MGPTVAELVAAVGDRATQVTVTDAEGPPVREVRMLFSLRQPLPSVPGALWVLPPLVDLTAPRLDTLILELGRGGAAGLAVAGSVSESTRLLASRLRLALVVVAPDVMDAVVRAWYRAVDGRALADLRRLSDLRSALFDAWLSSADLEAYLDAAGRVVGGRVGLSLPGEPDPDPDPHLTRHTAGIPWGKGKGAPLWVDLPKAIEPEAARALVRDISSLVAMRIDREAAPIESEIRLRGELLLELLVRNSPGGSAIRAAQRFGLDLGRRHLVALWDLDDFTTAARSPEMTEARILRLKQEVVERLERGARQHHRKVWVLPHSDEFVLIVESEGREPDSAAVRRTMQALQADLAATLARYGVPGISAGVGFAYPGSGGLRKSFEEAREALLVGLAQFGQGSVTHFGDLGIHRFLYGWVESPRSRHLAADFLRPLVSEDARSKADLLRTLRVYLEARGKSAAAQALGIHRNSLEYRLSRIQQLLGVDLGDPNALLVLQLLVRAMPEVDATHEN
jgi:sugar diacid utilization regulator